MRRFVLVAGLFGVLLSGCGSGGDRVFKLVAPSMEPTYRPGVHVEVDTHAYDGSRPKGGDVVVIHPPQGVFTEHCGAARAPGQACPKAAPGEVSSGYLMKRVVAVPGQSIAIRNGQAVVNGKLERYGRVASCAASMCNFPTPVRVGAGLYFLLGDNRGASDDSRFWGPIPRSLIVGKVVGVTTAKAHGTIGF